MFTATTLFLRGQRKTNPNRKGTLLLAQTECLVVFVCVFCLCFKNKVEEFIVKLKTTVVKMFEAFVIYLYRLKCQILTYKNNPIKERLLKIFNFKSVVQTKKMYYQNN